MKAVTIPCLVVGENSVFEVASSAAFQVGRVTAAGSGTANNNAVYVSQGKTLKVGSPTVGVDGVGNTVKISGESSTLEVTGATASVSQSVRIHRGQFYLGKSSVITSANGILIGLGGRFIGEGQVVGNIQQAALGSGSGAGAEVGDGQGGYGILDVVGNWDNSKLTLTLKI